MYLKSNNLTTFTLITKDGDIGSIDDIYFDPIHFSIRYIIFDTRRWFLEGKVLLSPAEIANINMEERIIDLNVTKEQIKNSPKPNNHSPISFAFENKLSTYYGWNESWKDFGISSLNEGDLSGTPITGIGVGMKDGVPLASKN
ncbi:PRC-barrel domain-containing protein [Halalkalibacter flavus]|jgi:hypothetical protein|uniref:PRC-barrel domain-containing protein n=1 Tax=Halalkalibacter flavus TaxID=3090668 RepID=UPI002FC951DD